MANSKHEIVRPVPEALVDFLRDILPFNELAEDKLVRLARHFRIDFYPKGTRLFTAGKSEVEYLYLIQKGAVQCFITDDEGDVVLKDFRGEGAHLGALPIIQETLANLDVVTTEDTFCFLLPKAVFLKLLRENGVFAQYYLKRFSEKLVTSAYSELRRHRMNRRTTDDLYLFSRTAGEIIKTMRWVPADTTIQQAAAAMARYQVGSLLISAPGSDSEFVGIITDRDLRAKVIAAGLDYQQPVTAIMSSPLRTVAAEAVCFDVLLKMMTSGIHHLAVSKGGRVIGVITSHDIMLMQGHSPYYLFKEIVAAPRIEGLYDLARKFPTVVRSLIKEGGKAGSITRTIAILNDHLLERLLTLLEGELGPPPCAYCWLLMGSEGRREQTFKTDQDNAIVYADPADAAQREVAETYFAEFARRAIEHLVKCGYPPCPGDIMATNPRWRQPLAVWKEYFSSWVATPDPEELLHSTIFFDFRAGFGADDLAEELRNHLLQITRRQEIYLLHMARQCMNTRVPLSFFRNFIVQRDGEHRNKLDLKHQGLAPFVDFARVLSLQNGIWETNTLARFEALGKLEHIKPELASSAREAYEIQMQLRLIHQLHQLEEGKEPDNYINPSHLNELERHMLKDAFSVIERLHAVLHSMFPDS